MSDATKSLSRARFARRLAGLGLFLALGAAAIFAGRRFSQTNRDQIFAGADFASVGAPNIFPDCVGVEIPPNIAPLNFELREEGREFATRFSVDGGFSFDVPGKTVNIPTKKWRRLTSDAKGKRVVVSTCVKTDGQWRALGKFDFFVSEDPIDRFLHYRLIEPGYEYFNRVQLVQRDLETFEERVWFDAKAVDNRTCVNCHSFQDRGTDAFLFHTRRASSGTILYRNGVATKIDPNLPNDPLGAAYPAWNPRLPLIAFSTNATFQMFRSLDKDRIEVLDAASDLILFDAEQGTSRAICETSDALETFPTWSPDGAFLYYCVAKSPYSDSAPEFPNESAVAVEDVFGAEPSTVLDRHKIEATKVFDQFHYNVARRSFDRETRAFGDQEIVFDAESLGKSAVLPRISPDGRTLVFTLSKNGTFPIWRRDADLWELNLDTGESRALDELNSDESESWREWDSSGKWLVFSSRRLDGTFTRVYFARRSEDGRWSKPFLLPQSTPRFNLERTKSYNLPTPTREPIRVAPARLVEAARGDSQKSRSVD
ncbi:MAG: PD40 domain-containing protein [Thermoguttaceae bacterium]|nr:PD40 domain-containing protein [Thermoguttaceae bacterium]